MRFDSWDLSTTVEILIPVLTWSGFQMDLESTTVEILIPVLTGKMAILERIYNSRNFNSGFDH